MFWVLGGLVVLLVFIMKMKIVGADLFGQSRFATFPIEVK